LPSILITNFTFDSVYSYLSTPLTETSSSPYELSSISQNRNIFESLVPDVPVLLSELAPLVEQIHAGYRCADLLLRLPGCIPIPSFCQLPSLPSRDWIDPHLNKLRPEIITYLTQKSSPSLDVLPSVPFPAALTSGRRSRRALPRKVIDAPLLVRLPTTDLCVYTPAGRSRFLSSIGIPVHLQDPHSTRILVVSFGGQIFHRPPSRAPSRAPSRPPSRSSNIFEGRLQSQTDGRRPTPEPEVLADVDFEPKSIVEDPLVNSLTSLLRRHTIGGEAADTDCMSSIATPESTSNHALSVNGLDTPLSASPRLATSSHMWIPGAPPVLKLSNPSSPLQQGRVPTFCMIPCTPSPSTDHLQGGINQQAEQQNESPESCLLPDSSWIAIVCGVSKEQWNELETDSELPDGFFVAPRNVYMPDLMAVADVLLGKLVTLASVL
jgi:hypothetical protein